MFNNRSNQINEIILGPKARSLFSNKSYMRIMYAYIHVIQFPFLIIQLEFLRFSYPVNMILDGYYVGKEKMK